METSLRFEKKERFSIYGYDGGATEGGRKKKFLYRKHGRAGLFRRLPERDDDVSFKASVFLLPLTTVIRKSNDPTGARLVHRVRLGAVVGCRGNGPMERRRIENENLTICVETRGGGNEERDTVGRNYRRYFACRSYFFRFEISRSAYEGPV